MTDQLPEGGATHTAVCQHGNTITPGEVGPCKCMLIDGSLHPCRGCHHTCGNCL